MGAQAAHRFSGSCCGFSSSLCRIQIAFGLWSFGNFQRGREISKGGCMVYWVTGGVLLVYLVLVWFIGTWANPPGSGIWILRIGLWLIGLLGAGFAVWWF